MTNEQIEAMAMHITDNFMSSVVASIKPTISTEDYANEYFNNYVKIKNTIYRRNGIESKLNSFIDDTDDTIARHFK